MNEASNSKESSKTPRQRREQSAGSAWILLKKPWHEIFIHVSITFGAILLLRSLLGDVSDAYQRSKSAYPVGDSVGKSYVTTHCGRDYEEKLDRFHAYLSPACGVYITDKIGTTNGVKGLLRVAQAVFELGSTTMKEESSVFDFHTGTLSRGQKYVNIFQYMKKKQKPLISVGDVDNYNAIVRDLLSRVAGEYQVPPQKLYITQPTFFSKLSSLMPSSKSEYWHPYVGGAQGSDSYVHFSAILYLGTYGKDFGGGRVSVVDNLNRTQFIEPKLGRLIFYNFGSDLALHHVTSGYRYALVASFTLDHNGAMSQPTADDLHNDSSFASPGTSELN